MTTEIAPEKIYVAKAETNRNDPEDNAMAGKTILDPLSEVQVDNASATNQNPNNAPIYDISANIGAQNKNDSRMMRSPISNSPSNPNDIIARANQPFGKRDEIPRPESLTRKLDEDMPDVQRTPQVFNDIAKKPSDDLNQAGVAESPV